MDLRRGKTTKVVPMSVKVIDLFAGPGGLGEGFSAYKSKNGESKSFDIVLSIEKEQYAVQTLLLRKFFRQFQNGKTPDEYYNFLNGEMSINDLYESYPEEYNSASSKTWKCELGVEDRKDVDKRIKEAVGDDLKWILIGGPPCQAYSVIGRSRTGSDITGDVRIFLYQEYLRILAVHQPPIFIMENVPGILSAKLHGNNIFDWVLEDLKKPVNAIRKNNNTGKEENLKYKIYSLSKKPNTNSVDGNPFYKELSDFVVKAENYGVPQSRHRVILFGIRSDFTNRKPKILKKENTSVSVKKALIDLPRIRSGISKNDDGNKEWKNHISQSVNREWVKEIKRIGEIKFYKFICQTAVNIKSPQNNKGNNLVISKKMKFPGKIGKWYRDYKLTGVPNHESRSHMLSDLDRYFFASCFAAFYKKSPRLKDFPESLLPNHDNVKDGIANGKFSDRFRVQLENKPATTVTSHISKDGHYYIHHDPTQCRSLTVREAARLQTFPDNYYFCGYRTNQFQQVGNAVPPLLALKISSIVMDLLERAE